MYVAITTAIFYKSIINITLYWLL